MTEDDFIALAMRNPVNDALAAAIVAHDLPDGWIVAGCLVQTVWNALTGRPIDYGIADYDVFYFDPDTSWHAEDVAIRAMQNSLGPLDAKIEVRNQARVHLWYPDKHGRPYPALQCATQGIDRFLTTNTQIGLRRRRNGGYDIYAPHGFDDIANMIVGPNLTPNFSAESYNAKAARWKALWPDITVRPARGMSTNATAPHPT